MTTVSVPQHLAALERANEVRLPRAQAKRDIRAGQLTVADALDLECCQSMRLWDLLRAQHYWGAGRARRLLLAVPAPDGKLVGTLTDRQRDRVRELLAGGVA